MRGLGGKALLAVLVAAALASVSGCDSGGGAAAPPPTASSRPAASVTATAVASPTAPLPSPTATATGEVTAAVEWSTYGRSQDRTFYNPYETLITRSNISHLRFKWRYLTGAVITASPSVAYVDVPGEGHIKVVFVASWDGNLYALRASNGSQLWHYTMKPHPGSSYPQASSAEIVTVGGEQRVFVGGGMTVYSLAAATGSLRWMFDAGTGCTTCDDKTERNEVLSSPTVVGDNVYFGMDVNDVEIGKGGLYAVNAVDGRLVWYFDLETSATCRPFGTDNVRRFDGYHSEAQLGLPAEFLATRPGCNFDRTGTGCGNVWSSFAVDYSRRTMYISVSNCDTDNDPTSPKPGPTMPPYDEALVAVTFEGFPAWVWRPREIDNEDLAFGGVPNLFQVTIGGKVRDVVGVGSKDGTYYLLDRDGVNPLTGRVEPYWERNVVPGGAIGGIISSASVADGHVSFGTAIGVSLSHLQSPSAWSISATDGSLRWSNPNALPSYSPTTGIPGVVFMGNLSTENAYDADTGAILFTAALGGPMSSAPAIVDGEVFIGAGTGARGGSPVEPAFKQSNIPSHISALCLPTADDCPEDLCDDGNECTYDFHGATSCESENAPDGLPCRIGEHEGACAAGACHLPTASPTSTS